MLAGLTRLTWLELQYNQISDVSALSGLTYLRLLNLQNNKISDVSALSGLTQLMALTMGRNQVSDISALSDLTQLKWLGLGDNQIRDISALSELTQLTTLELRGNELRDISPLVDNSGIALGDTINLHGNPLNAEAYSTHIPTLQARGVTVLFDEQAAPEPNATEEITVDLPGGATMEMVWIEPGMFTMGSPDSEPGRSVQEGPQREVTISRRFWLGKYEITQKQWVVVMGSNPSHFSGWGANHPVENISWYEVQSFIHALNESAGDSLYRLPTEAEWEYACRAGTTTRWSFGDDESQLGDYAWYDDNACAVGACYPHEVGTKLPNPWGLYDMHGNVSEWCQDWQGDYSSGSRIDPIGPTTGSTRIMRGGSFADNARLVRSADRRSFSPGLHGNPIGARLLRMAEPVPLPSSDTGNGQQEIVVTTPAGTTHEMVLVLEGEFNMGSNSGEGDERPVHTVFLDGFYIDKYEVTNAQYQAFVEATDRAQSEYADDNRFNGPQQPVVGVSWFDANDYCTWTGLRLPTEAEWEKVARGTDGRTYPWGEGIDASKANYDMDIGMTTRVGSYPEGVSPYGAYDMAGNAWEWVTDWYGFDYYVSSPVHNPTGPESGSYRVIRGGSWDHNPSGLRTTTRVRRHPSDSLNYIVGFRCTRDQ